MTAPFYQDGLVTLYHGDCIEVMRELADESVHAVVTDPPYGLEFMGREWDGADGFRRSLNPADVGRDSVFGRSSRTSPEYRAGHLFEEWTSTWAAEALRVLKPGGHLLAFGGSRTWHRLAAGIEDAGFEIRDSIAWLYGSGFPKSLDVSKAIDKAAGYVGAVTGVEVVDVGMQGGKMHTGRPRELAERETREPSADAAAWQGWGTALKPAFEPIVVGRKPLFGTVAANVLQHGTGALNIDATRVKHRNEADLRESAAKNRHADFGSGPRENEVYGTDNRPRGANGNYDGSAGRWPTNVVLDESQAAELDRQSGESRDGVAVKRNRPEEGRAAYNASSYMITDRSREDHGYGGQGGASRFFPTFRYEAKAPTAQRPKAGEVAHPTVKPLDLMRWLVRLVTPANGTVLEPFAGSGTTLEAALLEGFTVIGIEREADYLPLIRQRISKPLQQSLFGDWDGAA